MFPKGNIARFFLVNMFLEFIRLNQLTPGANETIHFVDFNNLFVHSISGKRAGNNAVRRQVQVSTIGL